MNKKTIIAFLAIAAVFLCGIAAAVFFLYRDVDTAPRNGAQESRKEKRIREKVSRTVSDGADVLRAVPSDAAAVFTFDSLDDAVGIFSDGKRLLRSFVTTQGKYSIDRYISALSSDGIPAEVKQARTAISLQYSGTLSPLLIVDCGHLADSSAAVVEMLSMAQSMGLRSKAADLSGNTVLLVSASEADVVSALKHIDAKASILDVKSFSRILAREGRDAKLFFSGSAASKLVPSMIAPPYNHVSSFLSTVSEWVVLDASGHGDGAYPVRAAASKGVSYFENVLPEIPSSVCDLPGILPSNAVFAVDLCLGDPGLYVESYRRYLDAHNALRDIDKPLKWLLSEEICEVAAASFPTSDGLLEKVLLARTSKSVKGSDDAPVPNDHAGCLESLFGKAFEVEDESVWCRRGEWIVSGSISAVKRVMEMETPLYETLGELDAASVFPVKVCGPLVYANLAEVPASALKEPLLSVMKSSMEGVTLAPAVLSAQKGGWSLDVRRCYTLLPSSTSSAIPSIEIPKGPFEVTNCGTGKKNLLYQNDNLYLCLKETSGKGLWGVSFDKPICGAVGEVDYYANGKIQFLFCAGSSLYLLDRLGRFCSGFPVELGKNVLLGPAVYDFSGAKKYNVMVLHTDNTIEMYNLQGLKPASWKGITCPEAITALPVLKKSPSGQKYWEVTTSDKTYTFDFWGGESQKIK